MDDADIRFPVGQVLDRWVSIEEGKKDMQSGTNVLNVVHMVGNELAHFQGYIDNYKQMEMAKLHSFNFLASRGDL